MARSIVFFLATCLFTSRGAVSSTDALDVPVGRRLHTTQTQGGAQSPTPADNGPAPSPAGPLAEGSLWTIYDGLQCLAEVDVNGVQQLQFTRTENCTHFTWNQDKSISTADGRCLDENAALGSCTPVTKFKQYWFNRFKKAGSSLCLKKNGHGLILQNCPGSSDPEAAFYLYFDSEIPGKPIRQPLNGGLCLNARGEEVFVNAFEEGCPAWSYVQGSIHLKEDLQKCLKHESGSIKLVTCSSNAYYRFDWDSAFGIHAKGGNCWQTDANGAVTTGNCVDEDVSQVFHMYGVLGTMRHVASNMCIAEVGPDEVGLNATCDMVIARESLGSFRILARAGSCLHAQSKEPSIEPCDVFTVKSWWKHSGRSQILKALRTGKCLQKFDSVVEGIQCENSNSNQHFTFDPWDLPSFSTPPQPSPEPEPSPTPEPSPDPLPSPAPVDAPDPSPGPEPNESPEPSPAPTDAPEPSPEPQPSPDESPEPMPSNSPGPSPGSDEGTTVAGPTTMVPSTVGTTEGVWGTSMAGEVSETTVGGSETTGSGGSTTVATTESGGGTAAGTTAAATTAATTGSGPSAVPPSASPEPETTAAQPTTTASSGATTESSMRTTGTVRNPTTTSMGVVSSPTAAPTPAPTRAPTFAPTGGPTPAPPPACAAVWQQCGGEVHKAPTCCQEGLTCTFLNEWFSQCRTSPVPTPAPASSPGPTPAPASNQPSGSPSSCAALNEQCSGLYYEGPTCCREGTYCREWNEYWSQCVVSPTPAPPPAAAPPAAQPSGSTSSAAAAPPAGAPTTTPVGGASGFGPRPAPSPSANAPTATATTETSSTMTTTTRTGRGTRTPTAPPTPAPTPAPTRAPKIKPAELLAAARQERQALREKLWAGENVSVSEIAGTTTAAFKLAVDDADRGPSFLQIADTEAALTIPGSALEKLGVAGDVAAVASVFSEERVKQLEVSSPTPGETIEVTSVVNFEIYSLTGVLSVKDLLEPIIVRLPKTNRSRKAEVCAFWDEVNLFWSSVGLETIHGADGSMECKTRHLTLFASILRGFVQAFQCAQLSLLTEKGLQNFADASWLRRPMALILWALLAIIAALFYVAWRLDKKRSSWTDECFLIPVGDEQLAAERKESSGSMSCCKSRKKDGSESELSRAAKLANGAVDQFVMMSMRLQTSAALWLSPEAVDFVCTDKSFKDVLAFERQAPREETDDKSWGELNRTILDCMQTQWQSLDRCMSIPPLAARIFIQAVPLVSVFLMCPFRSSKLRLLLLTTKLFGSLFIGALFFQASGEFLDKGAGQECHAKGGIGEMIGRIIAVGIASLFLAVIPVFALKFMHSRKVTKVDRVGGPVWQGQLKKWWRLDALLWFLATIYCGFCLFFIMLFVANIHPDDTVTWGTSGVTSLVKDELIIPLSISILVPLIAITTLEFANKMAVSNDLRLMDRLEQWRLHVENPGTDLPMCTI